MPPPPEPPKTQYATYLGPKETYLIITTDPDKYIASIPDVAMFQRNAPDKTTYQALSARTAVGFSDYEKGKLEAVIPKVSKFIETYYNKKSPAPWIFAMTQGPYYEGGKPHVRFIQSKPVIFLSSVTWPVDVWEDPCALGWALTYLRLAAVFPKDTKWKEHLLRERDGWEYNNRWPQWCDIWY